MTFLGFDREDWAAFLFWVAVSGLVLAGTYAATWLMSLLP